MSRNGISDFLHACRSRQQVSDRPVECRVMVGFRYIHTVYKWGLDIFSYNWWCNYRDKHSTTAGIVSVCVCLGAGTLYQQAPRRDEGRKQQEAQAAADLESSISLLKK